MPLNQEPYPWCECPGEQFDGHACEDFAPQPTLFTDSREAVVWMREWASTLTYEREKLEAAAAMLDDARALNARYASHFGTLPDYSNWGRVS